MTRTELRVHPAYTEAMEKIKGYKPGFRITIDYYQIPKKRAAALRVLLADARRGGLIELVSVDQGWDRGKFTTLAETYKRTEVQP